jgi:hypothetical protein
LGIWGTVETGLAITAASCATLRPLLRRFSSWYRRNYTAEKEKSTTQADSSTDHGHHQLQTLHPPDPELTKDKSGATIEARGTSPSTQSPTFFLDTVQSMDSIDEHFAQNHMEHFSEALPNQYRSFDFTPEDDLETNSGISAVKRATWWHLPRRSLLDDDGDNTQIISQSDARSGS